MDEAVEVAGAYVIAEAGQSIELGLSKLETTILYRLGVCRDSVFEHLDGLVDSDRTKGSGVLAIVLGNAYSDSPDTYGIQIWL